MKGEVKVLLPSLLGGVEELELATKDKQKQQKQKGLNIVSVDFVPSPGVEARLAKVYEILLSPRRESEHKDDER